MKHIFTILFFFITLATYAQSSSINYKAVVKDNTGAVVTNQTITVQLSILKGVAQTNVYQETHTPTTDANGLIIVNIGEGVTSDDFSTINWSSDDHFLNVQINTGSGLTDMGTTQFQAVPYALSAANVTGLEAIDEGNGIGYRLKGSDPAFYNDIGQHAVDLSIALSSSDRGASGINAIAMGYRTEASGIYSTAMGSSSIASGQNSIAIGYGADALGPYTTAIGVQVQASGNSAIAMGSNNATASGDLSIAMGANSTASGNSSTSMGAHTTASGNTSTAIGSRTTATAIYSTAMGRCNLSGGGNPTTWIETDPLLEVGNGIDVNNKSNAFTILKNGTITAPSFDLVEITNDKALITKEYADINLTSSGLEAIDEGNGIGWRLLGENPDRYGNIGDDAVDLSTQYTYNNPTNGATGFKSFATGYMTQAFGENSTALGYRAKASGENSTAMGYSTKASGNYSTAIGNSTNADAYISTAFGKNNIGGGNATTWVETDPLFEIGNGSSGVNRSNVLTVLKNGKVGIGNHQPTGFLEVKAANLSGEPNLNLIHVGTTGARINFSNTETTNGNRWTLYGDTNDLGENSYFNIYHPNAPSNGNIIQVKGDGKVGINGAPDTEFHITHGASGANDGLKLQNSGANANWWRFYTVNSTGHLELFSKSQGVTPVGNFNGVSGVYTSTSDRRLKKNFKDLHFNWADFMKLETLTYQYKVQKDTKEHIGLVAQDVALIYPELVEYNQEEDVYHMNYSGFGVVAIKAVQEQQIIIENQQQQIIDLKSEVEALKSIENQQQQQISDLDSEITELNSEVTVLKLLEHRVQQMEALLKVN